MAGGRRDDGSGWCGTTGIDGGTTELNVVHNREREKEHGERNKTTT